MWVLIRLKTVECLLLVLEVKTFRCANQLAKHYYPLTTHATLPPYHYCIPPYHPLILHYCITPYPINHLTTLAAFPLYPYCITVPLTTLALSAYQSIYRTVDRPLLQFKHVTGCCGFSNRNAPESGSKVTSFLCSITSKLSKPFTCTYYRNEAQYLNNVILWFLYSIGTVRHKLFLQTLVHTDSDAAGCS